MSVIACKDLVFKRGAQTFLEDVTFSLAPGSLMGLLGHNGAGKSTLIKLILGLLTPAAGELSVLDARPGSCPLRVGYLPENVSFYDAMTVKAHLDYFARLKGVSQMRVSALIDRLGLAAVANQKLGQCSKGQRQRLGLAQAILSEPALLLLDEPTVGLDPVASAMMYQELSELRRQGCSIVVCTHELSLVEPYLDCALLLAQGKQKGFGALDALRTRAELSVKITYAGDFERVRERLPPCVSATPGVLYAPQSAVADVIRLLTQELGLFDIRVQKADLWSIFQHYVLAQKTEFSL